MFETIQSTIQDSGIIWTDSEFIERNGMVNFISVSMIDDNDNELYIVNPDIEYISDLARNDPDPWVFEHVLKPEILYAVEPTHKCNNVNEVKDALIEFCGINPRFWAYCAAFDWVAIRSSIFGRMIDSPKNWPYAINDFAIPLSMAGLNSHFCDPLLSNELPPHNALPDTRQLKRMWKQLMMDAVVGKFQKSKSIIDVLLAKPR
jgi:hypothetical protein